MVIVVQEAIFVGVPSLSAVLTSRFLLHIQCFLDLPFFKEVEKTNDDYEETVNPENHFFN
jgi:hypothetical protein